MKGVYSKDQMKYKEINDQLFLESMMLVGEQE